VVETVEPLHEAQNGSVFWFKVKLEGVDGEFALHANWFALHGDLNPGDRVSYEVSKAKLDRRGSQTVNAEEGYLLFDKLRKSEGEKSLEEEMKRLVKEGA